MLSTPIVGIILGWSFTF